MNLAAEVDANLRLRLRRHADAWPGGGWEERDGMLVTRLPGATHIQAGVAADTCAAPFEAALAWYGDEPFTLWLPGEPVVVGAEVVEEIAAMAAAVDDIKGSVTPIVVRRSHDDETCTALQSLATGFGLARPTARRLFPPALVADGSGVVGFVDGEPVTACWTVRSGAVVGLYGVITAARHRSRGYARTLIAATAEYAAAAGCTHLVLQTSTAAAAFAALGFTEVGRYRVVAPAYTLS